MLVFLQILLLAFPFCLLTVAIVTETERVLGNAESFCIRRRFQGQSSAFTVILVLEIYPDIPYF